MNRAAAMAVAFLVVLVLAPTANAAWVLPPRQPVTAQTLLDRYLPIARAAWPGSPCEGQERVTLNDDAEISEVVASDPDRFPGDAGGMSFGRGLTDPLSPYYCRVGLRAAMALSPIRFCVVLTHEFGHLAGRDHNDIPGDVMNIVDGSYPPCWPADWNSRRYRLDTLVRSVLPRPDAWSISCVVIRGGALRCKASAQFAKRARYLWVSPNLRESLPIRTRR